MSHTHTHTGLNRSSLCAGQGKEVVDFTSMVWRETAAVNWRMSGILSDAVMAYGSREI